MSRTRTMAGRVLAIVAAVATVGIWTGLPANAVADGVSAPAGAFPFSVKFTMTNIPRPDGSHYNSACSGALIAPQWVITAGHCFHDVNRVRVSGPPQYPTTATLNTVDITQPGGETLQVVDVRQSTVNDIAVVKLAAPVTDVLPVGLDPTTPTMNEQLELAGWGATSSTNPTPSTHLNLGTVAVGSIAASTVGVHGVAPSADTSACLYDSGAPYFQPVGQTAGMLVSVESDGPDCPHDQLETTSRVDVIFDWILQQVTTG